MGITASDVKALRDKTSVGMMDCKKALTETDGDMEKAIDLLRKKGLAKAAKRADRSASQGLVIITQIEDGLSLFELACETDFVAKNDEFIELATNLAKMVVSDKPADVDALNGMPYVGNTSITVGDVMAEFLAKIGEKIEIGRFFNTAPEADPGKLTHYIHTGSTLAVVIDFATEKAETLEADAFKAVAHDVCLHTAAAAPAYLNPEAVPTEMVEREKAIYMDEAKAGGKPENIIEKIALGKLNKFYKDTCLVKQEFVKDNEFTIESLLAQASKELGDNIAIKRFFRIKIGEK